MTLQVELVAYGDNLEHLQGELTCLNARLQHELRQWRGTHHAEASEEELLGLFVSDREVDQLVLRLEEDGDVPEPAEGLSPLEERHRSRQEAALAQGTHLRLPELTRRMGLDAFEHSVVVLALAPELDPGYERLFAYLNDDATRRWPSVDLALRLFSRGRGERLARRRYFDPESTLRAMRLVRLSDESPNLTPSLLSRGLRLEARTAEFLLTGGEADPYLAGALSTQEIDDECIPLDEAKATEVASLATYLGTDPRPTPVFSVVGTDSLPNATLDSFLGRQVCGLLGRACGATRLLLLDGQELATHPDPVEVVTRALRESELRDGVIVVEEAQALAPAGRTAQALNVLLSAGCRRPRFLLAPTNWGVPFAPGGAPVLSLEVPPLDQKGRQALWAHSLDGLANGLDMGELAGRFRLDGAQILRAAHGIRTRTAVTGNGGGVSRNEVFAACRAQCISNAGELAQRLNTLHQWDDLILPQASKAKLRSLEHWLRFRHVVHDDWGFSRRTTLSRGMAVLFSGSPGTGKTMAAGIIANSLDLDLYRVDLSTVVSKYIGETEKNLGKVFAAAEAANAILFFDEADSLFGKRSDVKDAHDRYANIEVSFLLQRMESYDGLAILATNIRQNLDRAFARRLQLDLEFPFPSVADRLRIWERLLTDEVPKEPELDLAFVSRQFALTGGHIKNCALNAALAAAAAGEPVAMRHLIPAIAREFQKLEKPVAPAQFGPYAHLMRG